MEWEIDKNRTSCKTAKDCKTCQKLPVKVVPQCIDSVCWGVNAQAGFLCKGKPDGTPTPGNGECNKGKQWMRCPEYVAMCDLGAWSKCSKVFTSPWSHILVHWGIAEEGGALDFSLPQLGTCWFLLLMLYPFLSRIHPIAPALYSLLGAGSLGFNGYLAWVLKTKLKEFCIVCFSTYIINGSSVLCIWYEWRNASSATATNGNKKATSNGNKKVD